MFNFYCKNLYRTEKQNSILIKNIKNKTTFQNIHKKGKNKNNILIRV